ncbi:hypothetical protein SAMN02745248_01817 [Hathewaya proteolytica DSM 3090]|uniref:Extracellular solute-binding protein, family 3 n=2 Tax=Hathewaya proteolytica TaxID=29365 RepID=A0A1M6PUV0_9CLOT|nr:hypothetical protein SAMN02745248_01817 [Hathewaya proteolytica DSM 3090]
MALSSDALDVAIICSSKAQEFKRKDSRFFVFDKAITNSSIIIQKDERNKSIGVSSGRQYEKDMVSQLLGKEYAPFAMETRALTYVMETGKVGGIVIDYFNSLNVPGKRIFPKKAEEFDTYSIIVNKKFYSGPEYQKFKQSYNNIISYLLEDYNMLKVSEKLFGGDYTDERRVREWQKLNIKIHPLKK